MICSTGILRVGPIGVSPVDRPETGETPVCPTGETPVLQHFSPLGLVFEHDLAEKADREHAVVQELVVEFFQREFIAFLGLVIGPQLEDLKFA